MPKRSLTINGRFLATENEYDHGTWTIHDHATGKRISTSVRTMGEFADAVELAGDGQEPDGQ